MPEIQEFVLQHPTMMCDYFHVEKKSKEYQRWVRPLSHGDEVSFYLEEKQQWVRATVDSHYIDDGSGNAPGANAHFYVKWGDEKGKWKYVLHSGLRVRIEAPTDAELIEACVWCEGGDWYAGYNEPDTYKPCSKHGSKYVTEHGQAVWYCDEHKPEWLKLVAI